MSGKRIGGSCPYNQGLDCDKHICDKGGHCGWHPLISEYRRRLVRKNELPSVPVPTVNKNAEAKPRVVTIRRDRGNYQVERAAKLRAEGKCPVCGKPTDRPDKFQCSACYERKRALEKANKEKKKM